MKSMRGRSAASKRYAGLRYVQLRCRDCGGWMNVVGGGESFEELLRLGLCATCFAERYLDAPAESQAEDLRCSAPRVPRLVQ